MLLSCIHKNEYCSSGAGGELNCLVSIKMNTAWQVQVAGSTVYRTVHLDVAGAYSKWALNISGPNSDWACAIGP